MRFLNKLCVSVFVYKHVSKSSENSDLPSPTLAKAGRFVFKLV